MKAKESGVVCRAYSTFRIAGVPFVVAGISRQGLKVRNPLYRRFALGNQTGVNVPAITIEVKLSPPPALEGMRRIFDTRESWALFDDEKRLWAVYHPQLHARPFWVAGFDRRANRVDYFFVGPDEPIHPVSYPLDQLLLMYFFARRKGILTHAAGIVRGGKAFIFPGASGAGKSTLSLLLAASRAGKILSDERMIVREIDKNIMAFGTPWAGTAGIARASSAPLAGIFFLKHGTSNRIKDLDPDVAADHLLPLASIPWYDPDTAMPIIAFAKRLAAKVPAYEMSFTPDRSAIDFFWKFIKKTS
jgi:hypothetical protein